MFRPPSGAPRNSSSAATRPTTTGGRPIPAFATASPARRPRDRARPSARASGRAPADPAEAERDRELQPHGERDERRPQRDAQRRQDHDEDVGVAVEDEANRLLDAVGDEVHGYGPCT